MNNKKIDPFYLYILAIISMVFVVGFGLAEIIQQFAINDVSLVPVP